MTPLRFHQKNRAAAFTLVEVIMVICIIAILCTLSMVGLGQARSKSDSMKCASNLKQIGVGILLYAQDHDGVLPGPLYSAQSSSVSAGNGQLVYQLQSYLSYQFVDTSRATIFECPAWKRLGGGNPTTKAYYVNASAEASDGSSVRPFGYKSSAVGSQPIRLLALKSPGSTSALFDHDSGISAGSDAPPKPAHVDYRNTLYFDGHVEAVPIKK